MLVAVAVTLLVAALAYGLPRDYSATGVGLAFLAVTYWLVLRTDDNQYIRHHGLALGGLLEVAPLDAGRLLGAALRATAWALACAAVVFPPYWLGFVWWFSASESFKAPALLPLAEQAVGQLLIIALPEEAFYRGYLQTTLDDCLGRRRRLLGARVGWGLVIVSALFAAGHVVTQPNPTRLAVFFPALLFGWLRSRSGGIGAPLLLHAMSNLFAEYLRLGYGL